MRTRACLAVREAQQFFPSGFLASRLGEEIS
jgi:hypothetical protein